MYLHVVDLCLLGVRSLSLFWIARIKRRSISFSPPSSIDISPFIALFMRRHARVDLWKVHRSNLLSSVVSEFVITICAHPRRRHRRRSRLRLRKDDSAVANVLLFIARFVEYQPQLLVSSSKKKRLLHINIIIHGCPRKSVCYSGDRQLVRENRIMVPEWFPSSISGTWKERN